MSENDAPSVPVPDYRPVERFWPYIDLPEQPSNEELARSIPSSPRPCSAVRRCRFRSRSSSRPSTGPTSSARWRWRAPRRNTWSARGRRRASPRAVLPAGRRQAARPVRDRRALRRDRRPRRRPARSVRARALAAPALVPDQVTSADVAHGRTHRPAERPVDARRGAQASRGGIQHVLRRPAAAAAVGGPRPGRGADQAARPRLHHSTADRFRFDMLQRASRRSSKSGIAGCAPARTAGPARSRSRGRRRPPREGADSSKVLHVTALRDPLREMDKVHALYDSLMEARRGRATTLFRSTASRRWSRIRCRSCAIPEPAKWRSVWP